MAMAKSVAAVKSSVYSVQLCLLDGISDEDKLRAAGKVLTHSEYTDVVTERSIVDMCGYPLCANSLPSNFPHKGRYRIALREHKVYDLQETRLFCSSDCLVASKTFAASLPLERDHSTKTLELAAAFHNLGVRDADQQNQASSLAAEKVRPLIQELDDQCHQDTPIPVSLSVPVETEASQQPQQANAGTFLFIHEQNEMKVTDVNASGPSNAIEGYVPQKEFRSHRTPATDQDKKKLTNLFTAQNSKARFGSSVNKTEKNEKTASASRVKDSVRRASFKKEPEFRSCILFDYGEPATIYDTNKSEPASSCGEPLKGPTPYNAIDEEISIQNTVRQRSKRHNRVSWADHKNLSLVEELSPSNAANGRGILVDSCNLKLDEASNQALMADNSTSEKGPVAIKEGSGLLQRQGGFCVRKEQLDESSQVSIAGRREVSLQTQESSCFSKGIQESKIYEEKGDPTVVPDMVTSTSIAGPVGESAASPERQEHGGGSEETVNIQSTDFKNETLDCAKALVAALTEAAEAVEHGELDSSEAAARAGISILPNHELPSNHGLKEMNNSSTELENDVENLNPRDCWYSSPPKDFKPELSMFGMLWMALDSWISAASIAHVYGRDSNEEENFASMNGKEYLRQVRIPNGVSAEIERTLAGCISRTLPGLVETFRFPVPVSTLEVSMGRFMRTMSFMSAIPAFSSKQWQVVVLILLEALSVHRLPALRTRVLNGRQLLQKVLASANITEAEYEIFRDLVLPMGILPDFAAHCGG
ncbi:hypothetical protein GOP47_0005247 [Adiantum capillus-veneris]|uniref:RNA polymerase II subunit B1 CTD phosphatase RPAP2 homolog n=1 Tax=Adiantum capillus-veneris TaxID=13818 RepID=A0A9D4V4Z1_ADICA|nr:hypothetical protein GOP47_0005247 [Adiantum capillus-veneris]